MDVSIIIVNYNTKQMTLDCIDSVFRYTKGLTFEVLLVDNASIDGSKELFESDSRITYFYNLENVGFGRANNIGFKKATGKYVFLLNSDTILLNNAIKLFFDFMEKSDDSIACCGTLLRNSENVRIHSYGNLHTIKNSLFEWVAWPLAVNLHLPLEMTKYDNPKQESLSPFRVGFVTGADLFVRSIVAHEYGLFDPDYFMYSEDMDMQRRYAEYGYKSYILREPLIVHLVGKSDKQKKISRREMIIKSLFTYMRKHNPTAKYILFSCLFKVLYSLSFILRNFSLKEKIAHIKVIIKY